MSDLYHAILEEDIPTLRKIIDSGTYPDLNAVNLRDVGETPFYIYPLHEAAQRGNTTILQLLLEKGADINFQDKRNGNTALHEACSSNRFRSVQYLVEKGADLNRKGLIGLTPLALAIRDDRLNEKIVYYLIEKGADLNLKDNDIGNTPVMEAAREGYLDLLRYMVEEKGGDLTVENDRGETALDKAIARNDAVLLYLLKRGMDINHQDKRGMTALHKAIGWEPSTVKLLLSFGADPTIRNAEGKTPRDLASRKEIQTLLDDEVARRKSLAAKKLATLSYVSTRPNLQKPSANSPNGPVIPELPYEIVRKLGQYMNLPVSEKTGRYTPQSAPRGGKRRKTRRQEQKRRTTRKH